MLAGLLAVCLCGQAVAQDARSGSVRISLSANPTTIPADGKSRARIRIEVRDRSGQPLPDGTPILCHTDHGLLSTADQDRQEALSVPSEGGYATILCTSDTPGGATVLVRVQDSQNKQILQFVPKGEASQGLGRVLNIRGGWVGYCLDLNVIRARDGAYAQIGKLTFEATDGIEVRINEQTIRGWGVRIKRKGETLEAADFHYDMASRRGVIRRFGDYGVERVYFTAYGLESGAAGWDVPEDAFRAGKDEGVTWMVCRSCALFLGQKVVVKHASLYAGTQKVFSFPPYWVIGFPGYTGASNTQVVGLSTEGGLAVDFPLFYRVTDQWAGSVKVQRGVSGTSFVARDGWSIGIAEEYDTGDAKGSIELGGLFSSDWGLEWQDQREVFGGDQAFFNVGMPDHKSLFTDASIYHYGNSYRLNMRAHYDDLWYDEKTLSFSADWLTDPQKLTGDTKYRVGVSAGVGKQDSNDDGWVFANELYGSLEFNPWRLGKRTKLTPRVTNSYRWDTAEFSSNSLRGQLSFDHRFGRSARMGLNYYLNYGSGDTTRPGANHSLGMNFNVSQGGAWNAYFNGTWDATRDDTYAYLGFDWFFKPMWRFGVAATHYDYDATRYNDLEFGLARALGNREIGLLYSLDNGRLSLELGSFGF